jgi:hypothetical protein
MSDANLHPVFQAALAPHMPKAEFREMNLKLAHSDQEALARLVAETGFTENMVIQNAIHHESMNTDARRQASAAYHARREAAGLKKVTLWLSPEARDALDSLKEIHGSKDAAADAAILAFKP